MKDFLNKVLCFLRVTDEQGNLSLTNLSMYVAIVKLALAINPSFAEVGTFLLASAAYSYKKYLGTP